MDSLALHLHIYDSFIVVAICLLFHARRHSLSFATFAPDSPQLFRHCSDDLLLRPCFRRVYWFYIGVYFLGS